MVRQCDAGKKEASPKALMNIRVISGLYGGRKITAPAGTTTHPMGERVRNAMFNIVSEEIRGAQVLDAFAGSGAIGIEALSRGAADVVFIERDRSAQKAILDNITTLSIADSAKLARSSVATWVAAHDDQKFDIIFADPPYDDLQFSTVEQLLGLLKPGALMVLSQPGRSEVLTKPGVVVVDNRSYGTANLTFYRRVE
ncbi:MAG: 16S rRNA (guanine(966)-N(2))-methyltransferase RsmD [Chloroflexi bacterium]|nr:MAG: 16S rRNA (guanine(966)-N(2))-methyltransferase RsmD [Chloroflexota bacterium]